jgi:hypothetical protein
MKCSILKLIVSLTCDSWLGGWWRSRLWDIWLELDATLLDKFCTVSEDDRSVLVDSTTNGSEFVIGSSAPPLGVNTLLSARDPVYSSLSQSSGDGKSSPHFSVLK